MSILEKLLKLVTPKSLTGALTLRKGEDFEETVVAGLTPRKLAAMLKDAAAGHSAEFFALAEEMEELDPHYRSVLATRKLAVSGIEPNVTAAGDDRASAEIAAFVRDIVEAPAFADLVVDLLDGLAKGYSVVEIEWDTSGNLWMPARYVWRQPAGFKFDPTTRSVAHFNADGTTEALEPFRFCVHVPKLKSGLPVRGSLARMAAWSFLFKNYTVKDWVRFVEVYGMPIRVGKYTSNATEDDKRKLLRAVANIGSDAAAIIPASMSLEFQQAASGTAAQGPVFGGFAEYLDAQVSKGVLGQTMTSDDGSSKAQADVHNEVRLDILKADARQLSMTIMRDLIIPAVALNFGVQAKYPLVALPAEEPEDVTAWLTNALKAQEKGLAISVRQLREKLQADEPADAADVLGDGAEEDEEKPKRPGKTAQTTRTAKTTQTPRTHAASCPCCGGGPQLALTTAPGSGQEGDEIDRLVAAAVAAGPDDLDGLVQPVLALAAKAKSFDDFVAGLSMVTGEQEAGALMARLQPLMFIGRGRGDATDEPQ